MVTEQNAAFDDGGPRMLSPVITAAPLSRVIKLKYEDYVGTGFLLDVEGCQYWITAAHVAKGLTTDGVIEFQIAHDVWNQMPVRVAYRNDDLDILALSANKAWIRRPLNSVHSGRLSERVLVCGYPLSLPTATNPTAGHQVPMPIIKSGIIAAMTDKLSLLLDIIAPPGMSGAPVLVYQYASQSWNVCAVLTDDCTYDNPVTLGSLSAGIAKASRVFEMMNFLMENPVGPKI